MHGDILNLGFDTLAELCPTMMIHRENGIWCLHLADDEVYGIKDEELLPLLRDGLLEVQRRRAEAIMN